MRILLLILLLIACDPGTQDRNWKIEVNESFDCKEKLSNDIKISSYRSGSQDTTIFISNTSKHDFTIVNTEGKKSYWVNQYSTYDSVTHETFDVTIYNEMELNIDDRGILKGTWNQFYRGDCVNKCSENTISCKQANYIYGY